MAGRIKLGLVGVGKIARDQHLPAIAAGGEFELIAAASHGGEAEGVPNYHEVGELLAAHPEVEAISIATPPRGRLEIALAAVAAGKHVMIEKPPGATTGEVKVLVDAAASASVTLFAAWHSREAPGVAPARAWLAGHPAKSVTVTWREDIHVWHPGQDWILDQGGLGVFDPGINALSILTALFDAPALLVEDATLTVPEARQSPLQATLSLKAGTVPIAMQLDFLFPGTPCWTIEIEGEGGHLALSAGGAQLAIDGAAQSIEPEREYPRLYARFAELVGLGKSEADGRALQVVADAFLLGKRETGPAFSW